MQISKIEAILDPFSEDIDSFLEEKTKSPQEKLEDKVDEELVPMESVEQDHPDDEATERGEEKLDITEDKAPDSNPNPVVESARKRLLASALLRTLKGNRSVAESRVKCVLSDLRVKGYPILANKLSRAAFGNPAEILNNLLLKEYQQRDACDSYGYILAQDQSLFNKVKEHFDRESPRLEFLQKCIVSLKGKPASNRLSVPALSQNTPAGVIALHLQMELENIGDYEAAILTLPSEHVSLKAELTKILNEEIADAAEFSDLLK